MKRLLTLILILTGTFVLAFGQSKFSTGTQIILSARDGKMSLSPRDSNPRRNAPSFTPGAQRRIEFPYALPFTKDGVEMVTCWISMTNQDYNSLERLGVKIQARFEGRVTAQVPVDNLEKVAELKNVTEISVARQLKPNTYRSRVLTNVDDVLNLTNDAQVAGLIQAYDGTGVVLGVIDTGIDFNNQLFKDAQGNSRVKKAYVWDNSSNSLKSYTGSQISSLTCDNDEESHGTHTSSTAGGSNFTATAYVYTTSSSYQKVNNATFGGMAPGVDLVLCGLCEELTDANIAACIQGISNYADEVGKPCIISISLGTHDGPHDGTGYMANVCQQYTGEGKIIVYAASNDGDMQYYHYKENATKANPAMTLLASETRSGNYGNYDYGQSVHYARTPNVQLAGRFYVIDTTKDSIVWVSQEITSSKTFSVNTTGEYGGQLKKYFTNLDSSTRLSAYLAKDQSCNKYRFTSQLFYLVPTDDKYHIAVSVYPRYANATTTIDSWSVGYLSFEASNAVYNDQTYTFTEGNALCSVSNEATFPAVISIGAYCSSKYWYGQNYWGSGGNRYDWGTTSVYGGVCDFSSYQPEGYGPLGNKLPWITAPGEVILAAYNTAESADSYYYAYGTNQVLGALSGTSMSTPCAAGIIALWLQADPTLTPDDVKTVMKETAIHDNYTNGEMAQQFGNGKIDALGGIEYILEKSSQAEPTIEVTPAELSFQGFAYEPMTQTVTINARHLQDDITVSLTGDEVFSVDPLTITQTKGKAEATLTVTWSPTEAGETSATLTLSSLNAEDVVINLNGTAEVGVPSLTVEPTVLEFSTLQRDSQEQTFRVTGLHVREDITLVLNDENGVFSLDKEVIPAGELVEDGVDVTVTFLSADPGEFNASAISQCPGAEDVVIGLHATTEAVVPKILVEPVELTYMAKLGVVNSQAFVVSGDHLTGDVALELNDENGVFTLDNDAISLEQLMEGSVQVTVSFLSDVEGTYTGTVTLRSADADDIIVNLSAQATEGGIASDPWLNIAYYATIDNAGWNSNYVNQLYQYQESEDGTVAWLTLPIYGAWSSVFYAPKAQNWIRKGDKNSTTFKVWEAVDVFAGSAAYFTKETGNGASRGFGSSSKTNTANKYEVSFYVSNVTAVKLMGMGAEGNVQNYPAAIRIYECNKEADGTLSDGELVQEAISASTDTNEPFVIVVDEGLEADKVYRVEASSYRCFLYEIAFQRTLIQPLPTIPTAITNYPSSTALDVWYTLQGVRLAVRPTLPGLYIYRGRVVQVK